MFDKLKKEVFEANIRLKEEGLVAGTAGNVSAADRKEGILVIKPSGVEYGELSAEKMAVTDFEGGVIDGNLNPSVDTPHHLFIYKNIPEAQAAVHTHSPYAVMFAITGRGIPVLSTGHADIFGAEIPCAPYADNTGNKIGKSIIEHRRPGCPAVLLERHGVFVFEDSLRRAVNTAAMLELSARTAFGAYQLAGMLGISLKEMPPEEAVLWYRRHHGGSYGQ